MNTELSKYTTREILEELLHRESTDPDFYLADEKPTSYTFKFYKYE